MKFVICGYYGFANAGDEAILQALLNQLRAAQPAAQCTVLSGDPAATQAAHAVAALHFTDLDAITTALSECDWAVLGGGGLLHDAGGFDPASMLTPDHSGLAYYGGFAVLARLLRKPLALWNVGVGPLHTPAARLFTQAIVELAAFASVRDAASLQALRGIEAPVARVKAAADGAWLLPPVPAAAAGAVRPVLGVALRDWGAAGAWEPAVIAALAAFQRETGGTLQFVAMQQLAGSALDDAALAARIGAQLPHPERVLRTGWAGSPAQAAAALAGCDAVLAMRYHAALFAARAGVPVVALAYDPKVRQLLQALGQPEQVLQLKSLQAPRLAAMLRTALARRPARAAQQAAAARRLAQHAQRCALKFAAQLRAAPAVQPAFQPGRAVRALLQQHTLDQLHALLQRNAQLAETRLVVQARDGVVRSLQQELHAAVAVRDAQLRQSRQEMHAAVAARDAQLLESGQVVQARDTLVRSLQHEMHAAVAVRDAQLAESRQALQARDTLVGSLQQELQTAVEVRETQLTQLRTANAEQVDALAQAAATGARAARQLAGVQTELAVIHGSRYWQVLSRYWRMRGWLRLVLPHALRRRLLAVLRAQRAPARAQRAAESAAAQPRVPAQVLPATYDVLCLPVIDWDFRVQRPQQLLRQLVAGGQRVFYAQTTFCSGQHARLTELEAGVSGVQLPGPPGVSIYGHVFGAAQQAQCLRALQALRDSEQIASAVLLVQHPAWTAVAIAAAQLFGWQLVYDCMDEHAGFGNNAAAVLQQEPQLLAACQLALASSRPLLEKCAAHAPQALLLPNASDHAHFCAAPAHQALPGMHGPIIGYIGAIAEWFDAQLVRAAALARPHWQFVLVGAVSCARAQVLLQLPNILLTGEQPYHALPAYLHRFDVACIPFVRNALTAATDPVKLYEYCSAGKPVVAAPLPELPAAAGLYYSAETAEQFCAQVECALAEPAALAVARREFAARNTWALRAAALHNNLLRLFARVRIVVISFDNAALLAQCLDSVRDCTTHPNYEVLVVDNRSSSATAALLAARSAADARVRVLRNLHNAGFAEAANLGLRAPGDYEYAVLLNDDTLVTRGWLQRLLRHLADGRTGLVGPVTNFAGNEARIGVPYAGPAGVAQFAAQRARDFSGTAFEIPMLAMYCVAFRRALLQTVGALDEQFEVGMFEDDDFALRVRAAGLRVLCAEDVFVHHVGRASFGQLPAPDYERVFSANKQRFERKWGRKWEPHCARA